MRERADAERRGHAPAEEAEPGGEDVAEARDEKLGQRGTDDTPLAHVEEVAGGEPLEAVIDLARAHVKRACKLRLRPVGCAAGHELEGDDDILWLEAEIHEAPNNVMYDSRI